MKKFVLILIPIIILLIFISILNANFLFKSFMDEDFVLKHIENINQNAMEGNWEQVTSKIDELEFTLNKKIFPWIQLSVNRDEMVRILTCIARLKGYSEAKDKNGTVVEAYEIKNHWNNLGK